MINSIRRSLSALQIENWLIRETKSESAELFFIKKNLDMRRMTDVHEYAVTVYCDGTDPEGGKLRGSSVVTLNPGMTDEAIRAALSATYAAAGHAMNPYFELADPATETISEDPSDLGSHSVSDTAEKMAAALFAPDTAKDAFINSAEIFAIKKQVRVLTSRGTDVSFPSSEVNGEFVAQCKTDKVDVETHRQFAYRSLDTASLSAFVSASLDRVRDRAAAETGLPSGNYDVVLSDDLMGELLSFYASRANVAMIYPGYSDFKVGEAVGKAGKGEKLNLTMIPTEPYSSEGIKLIPRQIVRDGVLASIYGPLRFCRYLGVEPTGDYEAIECGNGTVPMKELTKGKCLHVVAFSDFQTDEMSGHFGGEIRLAYLYENGTVKKITGGSVNGSLLDAGGELVYSTERYKTADYNGPLAVRIPDVPVAGA